MCINLIEILKSIPWSQNTFRSIKTFLLPALHWWSSVFPSCFSRLSRSVHSDILSIQRYPSKPNTQAVTPLVHWPSPSAFAVAHNPNHQHSQNLSISKLQSTLLSLTDVSLMVRIWTPFGRGQVHVNGLSIGLTTATFYWMMFTRKDYNVN